MASLKQFFETDFATAIAINAEIGLSDQSSSNVDCKIYIDKYSNTRFISVYIENIRNDFEIGIQIVQKSLEIIESRKSLNPRSGFQGDIELGLIKGDLHPISNRVYVYMNRKLSSKEIEIFNDVATSESICLTIRDLTYFEAKMKIVKPVAFISHDSRDKEIAREIAIGLSNMLCPVWFDEYSLKIGDNLRESIEKGLKECKKVILILSNNFLNNDGWTKVEFNSVFTREIIERDEKIMPIWYGVSQRDVYEYSPSLANRVASEWSDENRDEIIKKIYRVLNEMPL